MTLFLLINYVFTILKEDLNVQVNLFASDVEFFILSLLFENVVSVHFSWICGDQDE